MAGAAVRVPLAGDALAGAALAAGPRGDSVAEGQAADGIEVGRLGRGQVAEPAHRGSDGQRVAAAQVVADEEAVLGEGARVHVQSDAGHAVGVGRSAGIDGRPGEGVLPLEDGRPARLEAGHPVELHEEILVHGVGAHGREVHVDDPVAVHVDPVDLPVVEEAVAVGVLADLDPPADAYP